MSEESLDQRNIEEDKEVSDILQLQDKLQYAYDNNDIKEVCRFILEETRFTRNSTQLSIFIQLLFSVVRARAFTVHVYVDILRVLRSTIIQDDETKADLENISKYVLERFSMEIQRHDIIDTSVTYFRFIRLCFNYDLITIDDILEFIFTFSTIHRDYIESLSLLFCYFAGDIYEKDEKLYNLILEKINKKITDDSFRASSSKTNDDYRPLPKCICDFILRIKFFADNERWEAWRNLANRDENSDELSAAIRSDNIDKFNKIVSKSVNVKDENTDVADESQTEEFDWNQRIQPNVFEHHYILQNEPTILQFAVYFGSKQIYNRIIESQKASINLLDSKGRSAIIFAVAGYKNFFMRDLNKRGLSLEGSLRTAAEFHVTSLFHSIGKIPSDEIENVNDAPNDDGNRPIKVLNEPKVDEAMIQDIVKNGFESFHVASKFNNFYVLNFYLKNGVDINVKDLEGRTSLHLAAINGNISIIKLLLSLKGIDPNVHDHDWKAPIHYAIKRRDILSIRAFCNSPIVDVNIQDSTKETPLHSIIISISDSPYLRTDKISHNNLDKYNTSEIINSYTNHVLFEVIRALLHCSKIDVNAVDQAKMTPLHWAIQSGFPYIVAELFSAKGKELNIDAVDEFDDSIRDYVRNSRNEEMIETFCRFSGENKEDYLNNQANNFGSFIPHNNDDDQDDDDDDDDESDAESDEDTESDSESDDSDDDD